MNETVDDLTPLAKGGRIDFVATAKVAAKVIGVMVPAIVAAVGAYHSAISDAQVRVQKTKNKSEAGYQLTRQSVEALEHRVLVLEEAAHRAELTAAANKAAAARKALPHAAHRLMPPPPPPPIRVSVTRNPPVLPGNLDQAERQIYRQADPAARPALVAPADARAQ